MLTDDQKETQPLLEDYGIIIAPEELSHATYAELSWALYVGRKLHPEKPIELRCCGDGGEVALSLALVDLIQADGNVDGICVGQVCSGHSLLWAACIRRFVYPNALLSIHQTLHFGYNSNAVSEHDQRIINMRMEWGNKRLIDIYTAASRCDRSYWRELLYSTMTEMVSLDAGQLIDLGMAVPISERGQR